MKKKLLVPVDFSPASHNAYLYARELARVQQASLEVIHVYSGSFSLHESPDFQLGKGREEVLTDRLAAFVDTYPQTEQESELISLEVSIQVLQGVLVANTILNQATAIAAEMIVMGNTGEHDAVERLMGSVSSGVAQKASCPVLLVPKGSQYADYKNILYASNWESIGEDKVKEVINWANTYRAAIHFIHVNESTDKNKDDFDALEDQLYQLLFKDGDPAFSFNMATIHSGSVLKGLTQYAEENKIDLIVLVNRQSRFLENVLGESLTKNMATKTTLPMLVLHYR